MREKVYFVSDRDRIAVTNKRLILNKTTFPISQITFVETTTDPVRRQKVAPSPRAGYTTKRIVKYGILSLFAVSLVLELQNKLFFLLSVMLICLYVIYAWEDPSADVTPVRQQSRLIIGLSSGKQRVFTSEDTELVQSIARAMNTVLTV
ncbi:hypothetical protein G4Y79_03805 [Phototrophicus methaneseepsis]|uniref:Uncharacterized protein n=1 Tax=Phototrophicus methaneseepsis TaxID=2710758 RepID=A0A7S8IFI5_9CHLR|nr:DUF6232 family protein [Phototrophicus methaneseepsis]QPC83519.1 hypothetical protein G4Y79_03805 [Phototrophicus methaneseepsis]